MPIFFEIRFFRSYAVDLVPTLRVGTYRGRPFHAAAPFRRGRGAWERDHRAKKFNCVTPIFIKI
jgi:hypothetical protein